MKNESILPTESEIFAELMQMVEDGRVQFCTDEDGEMYFFLPKQD